MNVDDLLVFFPEYSNKDLVITGYDSGSSFAAVTGKRVYTSFFSLFFLSGEFSFVESQGSGDINLVDGHLQFSLGTTQFGKQKSSNWVITLYEKSDSVVPEFQTEIEGAILAIYGKDFLNKKIFFQEVLKGQSRYCTPAILNPNCRISADLNSENFAIVTDFVASLDTVNEQLRNSIERSHVWLMESIKATGPDAFLKLWMAVEIGFTKTENTVKELRERFAKANDLLNEQVNLHFALGRIYGFRKDIIHRGKNPRIDGNLLDLMYFMYRDLLYHQLTGQKNKQALSFIRQREIKINDLFL